MQICNKYNLPRRGHGLNKPDRADEWKPQTALSAMMQPAAGSSWSVVRLPVAVLPQSAGRPIIGRRLFSQQMEGHPCQNTPLMSL